MDVISKIVAQIGATIDSFETFWFKTETHEQTMLDIGVLRFPDLDHPYFKVCFNDCDRSSPVPLTACVALPHQGEGMV